MLKRLTPLTVYLVVDQVARWKQRPSSILARLVAVAIMVTTATAILLLFHLAKNEIESRITSIGVNRIAITHVASKPNIGLKPLHVKRFLQGLNEDYAIYELSNLLYYADSELNSHIKTYAYKPSAWQGTFSDKALRIKNVLMTKHLPTDTLVSCWIEGRQIEAVAAKFPPWMKIVETEQDVLLLGDASVAPNTMMESTTTVYEHLGDEKSIRRIYTALMQWLQEQNIEQDVQVVHALNALDELVLLRQHLAGWRAILVVVFGSGISMIFSLIVVLEMYENRQVNLVLRSLGAPSIILVIRQLLEGLLVSNLAIAITWFGMVWGMPLVYESFGYTSDLVNQATVIDVLLDELPVIAGFVNFGLLISLIPVIKSVSGQIGRGVS